MLLTLLRCWVGLVAAMALVNAVQCFLDQQFPRDRIYDLQPSEGDWIVVLTCTNNGVLLHPATRLLSRTFGVWTLLAAFVRISFVVSPHNKRFLSVSFVSCNITVWFLLRQCVCSDICFVCAGVCSICSGSLCLPHSQPFLCLHRTSLCIR